MKKTGEDLTSNYGKIKKKLLLLAEAIKTILLTPHLHPFPSSLITENYEPQHLGP